MQVGPKGVRLEQKIHVGPCIPVITQLEKAEVGSTSGPARRLSRLVTDVFEWTPSLQSWRPSHLPVVLVARVPRRRRQHLRGGGGAGGMHYIQLLNPAVVAVCFIPSVGVVVKAAKGSK
jgi:hypothetical protein